MFFSEIVFYFYGLFLSAAKKAADGAHHLILAMGAFSAHGIRFDILIQHLVRIQFRTVAGKEKQVETPFLFLPPSLSLLSSDGPDGHPRSETIFP